MDHGEPMNNTDGLGEFIMSATGWGLYEGQTTNNVSMEAPIQVDLNPNTSVVPSKQGRKKVSVSKKLPNFSPYEDVFLVKSYLEVSCDAVTNTAQKKERLWERILAQYNIKRRNYPERSVRSLQSRWDGIKLEVGKYCGYHAEVLRSNQSGMIDADKTAQAAADFAEGEGYPFAYMHCWEIMKTEPKWQETKHNKAARLTNVNVFADHFPEGSTSVEQLANQSPGESPSIGKRPLGRDATKAARKKSTSTSSSSAASEFAANLQSMNLDKMNQWNKESERRAYRDEQFLAMEKVRYEEKLRLERDKLELEREKMELQRRAEEREMRRVELQHQAEEREREKVELQHRVEEERILSIELDKCSTGKLREYYKNLQDDIMERIQARRRRDM